VLLKHLESLKMRWAFKSDLFACLSQHPAILNRPLQPITCLRTSTTLRKSNAYFPQYQQLPLQLPFASFLSSPRRRQKQQAVPLDRSWGGELPDWELEPYDSEDEIEDELEASVLSPESGGGRGGGEFAFQNVLAAVLLGALALSFANILLKLGVVVFALVSAAIRYTSIGFLVIVILALLS
jgi:hypothetical protein